MTDERPRLLGTLGATPGGAGVVRLEDRFATDPADLWSALTEPARVSRWLGEIDGDLREGGGFNARFLASGWEGTGVVEACEPPRRLVVRTSSPADGDGVFELTLTPDGDGTLLVVEDRGMPLDQLPSYGAGDQVHLEDLAAHLAGRERCDPLVRWAELHPGYERLGVHPTA